MCAAMTIPGGFLGTDADLIVDTIVVALPVVLVLMSIAIRAARRRRYAHHRAMQLGLAIVLTIAVTALELDLRFAGDGVMELARRSRYAGTGVLEATLSIHLVFATSTALLWIALIALSLRRFGNPPRPGAFSRTRRILGWTAALDMAATAVTGGIFYVLCFVMT